MNSALSWPDRSGESWCSNTHSKCQNAGQRAQPALLYPPTLSAPAGNALVGSPREPPYGGALYRFWRSSSQPRWTLVERGPFLPIKTGQGNPETVPWLPSASSLGQQETLEDSPWCPGKRKIFLAMRPELSSLWWAFSIISLQTKIWCSFHIEPPYYSVIIFIFAWAFLQTLPSASFTPPTWIFFWCSQGCARACSSVSGPQLTCS